MKTHSLLEVLVIIAVSVIFAAQISAFNVAVKQSAVGIVYGANAPLAGVFVSANPSFEGGNGSGFAITNSSGVYSMTTGLTAGEYNVTAFANGYILSRIDLVNVNAGQATAGVDFDLQTSGGISGIVTDAVSGDPIQGANIAAFLSNGSVGFFGWSGTTGADGSYLLATNLVTGTYNVTIGYPPDGYIGKETTADVVAGIETKNVNLQLARSGIISGRVATPNGTGLFGISVSAISNGGSGYFGFDTTDLSGNYRITTGLGTGNYTVYASGAGNFSMYPTPVMVTAGQETSGIDLELTPFTTPPTPSGIITGRVTDQSNDPIVSASVTAVGSGGIGYGFTDDNGYYNITQGLGEGNDYNVSATASGYYDAYYPTLVSVTVDQTTPNINIQMTAKPAENFGTITGTVTGGANPIIPEFQYSFMMMLSLTLVTAVAGKLVLHARRNRLRGNVP